LQPYRSVIAEKQLQKQHCDCDFKKKVAKTGKVRLQKKQLKKLHTMTLSDCD
jgi:hypothetical protein